MEWTKWDDQVGQVTKNSRDCGLHQHCTMLHFPVLLADLEKWDLTEAASTPETVQRFFKHYNRIFDEAAKKVMAMQNAGMNVTVFLADLDNVNSAKHVNLGTSGYYWQAASLMEKHFPGMFNNIILINSELRLAFILSKY